MSDSSSDFRISTAASLLASGLGVALAFAWIAAAPAWEPAAAALTALSVFIACVYNASSVTRKKSKQSRDDSPDTHASTIDLISGLVLSAKRSVWLFRAHIGDGQPEEKLASALIHRTQGSSNNLEDVRRVTVIHGHPRLKEHLHNFTNRFHNVTGVRLGLYMADSPLFSFMIVDESIAVIGFPSDDLRGVRAGIVVRDEPAVHGLIAAWKQIERHCGGWIFKGDPRHSSSDREQILKLIDDRLERCRCDWQCFAVGTPVPTPCIHCPRLSETASPPTARVG
jgi:hypothetical protein